MKELKEDLSDIRKMIASSDLFMETWCDIPRSAHGGVLVSEHFARLCMSAISHASKTKDNISDDQLLIIKLLLDEKCLTADTVLDFCAGDTPFVFDLLNVIKHDLRAGAALRTLSSQVFPAMAPIDKNLARVMSRMAFDFGHDKAPWPKDQSAQVFLMKKRTSDFDKGTTNLAGLNQGTLHFFCMTAVRQKNMSLLERVIPLCQTIPREALFLADEIRFTEALSFLVNNCSSQHLAMLKKQEQNKYPKLTRDFLERIDATVSRRELKNVSSTEKRISHLKKM